MQPPLKQYLEMISPAISSQTVKKADKVNLSPSSITTKKEKIALKTKDNSYKSNALDEIREALVSEVEF